MARDQAHPQRDRRKDEPGVAIEQAVGRERTQDPLAVGGDPAHREHRIDGAHDQLELALVHAHPAADAHLDVVAELGAGHLGERAGDGGAVVAEQHGVDPGPDPVARSGGLLDQGEVGVTARVALQVLHFAAHPHLLGERTAEGVTHLGGEVADGKGRDLGDIPEVERLLAHRATRLTHPCDRKTRRSRVERVRQTRTMVDRIELRSAGVVLEPLELAHVDELLAAATEDRSTYAFTWVPHDVATMTGYVETALADERDGWSLPFAIRVRARRNGSSGRAGSSTSTTGMSRHYPTWWRSAARGWRHRSRERTSTPRSSSSCSVTRSTRGTWSASRSRPTLVTSSRAVDRAPRREVRRRAARAHKLASDGTIRDSAYFSILQDEWPAVKENLVERVSMSHT